MMNPEFDAGDVVLQRATQITDDDTIVELFDRTLAMFGPITVDGLALLESGAHRLAGSGPPCGVVLPPAHRGGEPHRLDLAGA